MHGWMSVLLVVLNPTLDQFPACCAGRELSPVLDADIKQETWENSVMLVCGKDAEERASGCLPWDVFPVRKGL